MLASNTFVYRCNPTVCAEGGFSAIAFAGSQTDYEREVSFEDPINSGLNFCPAFFQDRLPSWQDYLVGWKEQASWNNLKGTMDFDPPAAQVVLHEILHEFPVRQQTFGESIVGVTIELVQPIYQSC